MTAADAHTYSVASSGVTSPWDSWPQATVESGLLFNINLYFIRDIFPSHPTPASPSDLAGGPHRASVLRGHGLSSPTDHKLPEGHSADSVCCNTSYTWLTPNKRTGLRLFLYLPVIGRSEKAGLVGIAGSAWLPVEGQRADSGHRCLVHTSAMKLEP